MPRQLIKYGLIFLGALFIIIFWGFWQSPIALHDEALYANNALEMSRTNHFLVLTLDYQPDLYNTKPPMAIWLMAASVKAFGANEFAIRLPSLLAFLSLLIALCRFSRKYFQTIFPGIIAGIVLLGSQGMMLSHAARSGDLDSLLILFSFLFISSCLDLLVDEKEKTSGRFIRCGLFMLASYFIKSTTIFLFLPGLIICLILSPASRSLVRNKFFYIVPVLVAVFITAYYLMMQSLYPGYIQQVFFSEYKRVYDDIMPWHAQPFSWYVANLAKWRFTPFIFILPFAAVASLMNGDKISRRVIIFLLILSFSYLLIISFVPDKLEWYDLPVYPMWALIIGAGLNEQLVKISGQRNLVALTLSLLLLALPVYFVWNRIHAPATPLEPEKPAYCIKEIKKELPACKRINVLLQVENPLHQLSIDFYRKAYIRDINIKIDSAVGPIQINDTVLYTQPLFESLLLSRNLRPDTIYRCKFGVLARIDKQVRK